MNSEIIDLNGVTQQSLFTFSIQANLFLTKLEYTRRIPGWGIILSVYSILDVSRYKRGFSPWFQQMEKSRTTVSFPNILMK